MTTTMMGSNNPITVPRVASSSRSWFDAERSSMVSNSPLVSPDATMCTIMGGKNASCDSARFKLEPSCTLAATSLLAARNTRLFITAPAMRRASSNGTPDAIKILKVDENRAVSIPMSTRRIPGIRSRPASDIFLYVGFFNNRRIMMTSATIARPRIHPWLVRKSLVAMSATVKGGKSVLVWAKMPTISGTTKTMSAVTTAIATPMRTKG